VYLSLKGICNLDASSVFYTFPCKGFVYLSEKKRSEQQEGNGKIYPSECRGPRIARRDIRKPCSVINEKK